MNKYIKDEELKKYLNEKKKMAEKEQKKDIHDVEMDSYWQGYIDIIDTLAKDLDIDPLWC
jgi:hypothetical protein